MKTFAVVLISLFLALSAKAQEKHFYFKTSDGVKLYVHTAGAGVPCVFIHGGPGLTSYIFEATPAAKLIQRKLHMVYFDQRGSGRSDSAADYSLPRIEKDIEELRRHLHIKKWAVMGHSFGGVIMTAYAHDYLSHIDKMMYVHCTLNMTASLDSHIQNGTKLLKQAGVSYQVDTTLSKFDQMIKVHGELAKQKIEYKIMFRSQKEMDREDSLIDATKPRIIQAFNHFAFKSPEYMKDFAPYTPQITCPVLIIAGTKDYAVGPEAYKSWDFKHKKVVLYNGAHTSYQEEPEWFARVVLGFVK